MKLTFTCSLFLLVALFGTHSLAQPTLTLKPFATGIVKPVAISHAGDDRLFVVEKRGRILIVDPDGTVRPVPFLDIQAKVRSTGSEQGLLGLAFHPAFPDSPYFFVNHIISNSDTRVSRYQLDASDPDKGDPNSELILLTQDQPFSNHNGGDMHFGPDGYLYISMGDGGSGGDPQNNGQKKDTWLGKILRLDVDNGNPYDVPADNPFVGDADFLPEIWSWGWRNPWRFSFDRLTGDMWIADVGQGKVEEVSFEAAGDSGGTNYGWRCLEGDQVYNANGCATLSNYELPIFTYQHSFSVGTSITGGFVYRGQDFPLLNGYYVFGDYNSGRFWATFYDSVAGIWQTETHGALLPRDNLSAFGENKQGELFAAAINQGIVYQVEETTSGIDDPLISRIRLFPHPLRQQSNLEFDNPNGRSYTLYVRDLQGRIVRQAEDIRSAQYVLERGKLSNGVYLIEMRGEDRSFSGKLVVME